MFVNVLTHCNNRTNITYPVSAESGGDKVAFAGQRTVCKKTGSLGFITILETFREQNININIYPDFPNIP